MVSVNVILFENGFYRYTDIPHFIALQEVAFLQIEDNTLHFIEILIL